MQPTAENRAKRTELAQVFKTDEDRSRFQLHLQEVIGAAAFRGSPRCAEFLKYVVGHAITGQLDDLKERTIGIAIFGRSPSYDTGDDAIVRVTASEVRKRLLQHYGSLKTNPEFQIKLPLGAYIPEITRNEHADARPEFPLETRPPDTAGSKNTNGLETIPRRSSIVLFAAVSLVGLIAIVVVWSLSARTLFGTRTSPAIFPWSTIFSPERSTVLVTSDPNIAEIVGITHSTVSVSDYANQQYFPRSASYSPEILHLMRDVLRGDKAANVDTPIVANLAVQAHENRGNLIVRPARDLRLSDLDTDNNFIFLGSPRTDPWVELFNDQVDLKFVFDDATQQEIVRDVHPHQGEPPAYIPTAKGLATGESFALITYAAHPNHAGQVLILAGASAEGTKATGELIANSKVFSSALHTCGLSNSSSAQHFQLLLHVKTMAGAPTQYEVLSCHVLP